LAFAGFFTGTDFLLGLPMVTPEFGFLGFAKTFGLVSDLRKQASAFLFL